MDNGQVWLIVRPPLAEGEKCSILMEAGARTCERSCSFSIEINIRIKSKKSKLNNKCFVKFIYYRFRSFLVASIH